MENLNLIFFEEFKCLDKLCKEIYNSQFGVTDYINEMKTIDHYDYQNIPDWQTDLKELHRIRHIRNELAHNTNSLNDSICTQQDIDWIRGFYNRILHQNDPISIFYQRKQEKSEEKKESNISTQVYHLPDYQTYNIPKNKNSRWLIPLLVIGVCLLVIVIVTILLQIVKSPQNYTLW